jgi:hypothetical protein
VSPGTASISTSSSTPSSASTFPTTASAYSPRSNACGRASSSSTPSCGCTASTRTPPPRSPPLLAYLRELQRSLGCAVALVHHARKGGHARAGQALRGSSELHAWGDSNLYLRRDGERLLLAIEHRAAPSSSGLALALGEHGGGLTLRVCDDTESAAAESPRSPAERVLSALADAPAPLTRRELRDTCRLRNATLVDTLAALQADGRVRVAAGHVQLVLV